MRVLALLDGTLADPDSPQIRVDDLGLMRGDGVFETILVVDGKPRELTPHLDRLDRSAAMLDMLPPPRAEFERAVELVIGNWAGGREFALKLVYTRGVEEKTMRPGLRPMDIYMTIASASFFNVSNRYTFQAIFGHDMSAKAEIAHQNELVAIVCIGETGDERKAGKTLDVLKTQLAASVQDGAMATNTVIAYEPVWAIGTGLTPTAAGVEEAHAFMRAELTARFAG